MVSSHPFGRLGLKLNVCLLVQAVGGHLATDPRSDLNLRLLRLVLNPWITSAPPPSEAVYKM